MQKEEETRTTEYFYDTEGRLIREKISTTLSSDTFYDEGNCTTECSEN